MFENWNDLENAIVNCKRCDLAQGRRNIVLGQGNKNANIMFIGEVPSMDDDKSGVPFAGKDGRLIGAAIEGVGLAKEDIYFTNIVKCRGNGGQSPRETCINTCINLLRNQVVLIKPQIIVLMGSLAINAVLGKEYNLINDRGRIIELKGIKYLLTWNPVTLLNDESKKIEFWKDLKSIV